MKEEINNREVQIEKLLEEMNLLRSENSALREKLYALEAMIQRKREDLTKFELNFEHLQKENE